MLLTLDFRNEFTEYSFPTIDIENAIKEYSLPSCMGRIILAFESCIKWFRSISLSGRLSHGGRMIANLNDIYLENDGNYPESRNVQDNNARSEQGDIIVYFRNLEERLIEHIKQADLVVGCIAWLTHDRVLSALAGVPNGVAIVVQKEDFLRPDIGDNINWKRKLNDMYKALPEGPDRYHWPGLIGNLSVCGDPVIDSVRCVGNYNKDKSPAFPRMHNKFLVFCKCKMFDDEGDFNFHISPYLVWTGSFNLTKNASFSLENAIVISDPSIVDAYYREWEQIEAISEPLDWQSEWSVPKWRIGT